ncbi:peptidoglycan DD-metalloendopeptidase family protein [Salisediminibacterium halotolerans]|uniref:Peptidase family M23 n=1 Tax=Salisediminibacterium halotolerans TaxID=517425 RepID=A0A1H9WVP2_9BACI|nr:MULTISPECIES: peptidoglycan DD-metalloendopeptidase family protein [Salisediminibacterium]RLJ74352.1 peptidase M23-like protein [Actinophytocola xinjiangensis]RPE87555.1 peptidase M23-like protein [Salisediminibacterium halotolerans]TWG35189.1 peptidase M23-like protein [Salisediminibacterium halotolerans]SES37894.1 Peptidase family M23 [Salisediminibacterium haloalkalitolerans]GEL08873.1 hypothetical protein SHA02_22890 [Salisediminibacterium halotolerans]
MKRTVMISIAGMLLAAGCSTAENETEISSENTERENNSVANNDANDKNSNAEEKNEKDNSRYMLETHALNDDESFVSLKDLAERIDAELEADETDRTADLKVGNHSFFFVEGVPVVERDGIYLPSDDVTFRIEDGTPYVSKEFLQVGFEKEFEADQGIVSFNWEDSLTEAIGEPKDDGFNLEDLSQEEMKDYLSFMASPIENATVSTESSHLPGAPRDYRNGEHEGIDWYDHTSAADITTETPVLAQAEGEVVRADHDFEDYQSHDERNEDLAIAEDEGYTPEYILDRLRGQQVWVQYPDGVMMRYAHLDDIPEEIEVGQTVDEDTKIGYVGNSGTSGALDEDGSGLHLHHDLLIYGELFWQPYTLEETAEIIHYLWG